MANVKKRPASTMSTCGTTNGAVAHDSRGEERCRPCKDAWNAYWRAYRAKNRGTKRRTRV